MVFKKSISGRNIINTYSVLDPGKLHRKTTRSLNNELKCSCPILSQVKMELDLHASNSEFNDSSKFRPNCASVVFAQKDILLSMLNNSNAIQSLWPHLSQSIFPMFLPSSVFIDQVANLLPVSCRTSHLWLPQQSEDLRHLVSSPVLDPAEQLQCQAHGPPTGQFSDCHNAFRFPHHL